MAGTGQVKDEFDGIVISLPSVTISGIVTTKLVDEIVEMVEVGSYTYFGFAPAGSSYSSAVWKIFRLDDETSGLKRYANGVTTNTQIWDDGAGIDYSTYSYS